MKKIVLSAVVVLLSFFSYSQQYDGHFSGLYLGVNYFQSLHQDYNHLALDNKSINVKLNFIEINQNLYKQKLGLTTGLGLEWANYRFKNDVNLDLQPSTIFYDKNKLVVSYLNIPLFIEYQTNSRSAKNSFHVLAGSNIGCRIGSHTKIKMNDDKEKNHDDYFTGAGGINSFKYEAVAGIGWGFIDVYGTYSLNPLFNRQNSPAPYSVVITFKFGKKHEQEPKAKNSPTVQMFKDPFYWVNELRKTISSEETI